MRKLNQIYKNENGSSNVLIVLSMTILISMVAMVVDFSTAYIKTSQTQTAADAAVLAAGLYLPVKKTDLTRQSEIKNIAKSYLEKNGIINSSVDDVYFTNENNGYYFSIGINVSEASKTGFARIMGINAVSYTHLDVYKRQIYYSIKLKSITKKHTKCVKGFTV